MGKGPRKLPIKRSFKDPKIINKPDGYAEESIFNPFPEDLSKLNIEEKYDDDLFSLMDQGYSLFNHESNY